MINLLKKHKYEKLKLPGSAGRLLLLSCCAPCSANVLAHLKDSKINTTVLFYNPNIHPEKEYIKRKKENKKYAEKLGFEFVDLDSDYNYKNDSKNFIELVKRYKYENEPEKGKRCSFCFYYRLKKAAEYAFKNGFRVFSSTLGVSRYKDFEQVNKEGFRASNNYPDLIYWDYNFRKNNGEIIRSKIVKNENMYNQDYCGCVYSKINRLRDQLNRNIKNNKKG